MCALKLYVSMGIVLFLLTPIVWTRHRIKSMFAPLSRQGWPELTKRELSRLGYDLSKRVELPKTLKEIQQSVQGRTEYEFGPDCNIISDITECQATLIVQEDKCKAGVDLSQIIDLYLPEISLETLTNKYITPAKFLLLKLSADKCKNKVSVHATSKESFDLVDRFIVLANSQLQFSFSFAEMPKSLEDIDISLVGQGEVGSTSVEVTAVKQIESKVYSTTVKVAAISLAAFVEAFGVKLADLHNTVKDIDIASLSNIKPTSPEIKGYFHEHSFQFVMLTTVEEDLKLPSAKLVAVVSRQHEELTGLSILIEADSQKLTVEKILSKITKLQAQNIPLIKKCESKIFVGASTSDIMLSEQLKLPEMYAKLEVLKGFVLIANIPIKSVLSECDADADVSALEDSARVSLSISKGKIIYKNFMTHLKATLRCFAPDKKIELPSDFFKDDSVPIRVKMMIYDEKTKSVSVTVSVNGPFKLMFGLFTVNKMDFVIRLPNPKEDWDVCTLPAEIKLFNRSASIVVTVGIIGFKITGDIEYITAADILSFLNTDLMPKALRKKIGKLQEFGIKDFHFEALLGKDPFFRIQGNPMLFGFNDLFFEGMIWKDKGKISVSFGLVFRNARLDELLEKIFGKKILSSASFNEMTAGIIISNAAPGLRKRYSIPYLRRSRKLYKNIKHNHNAKKSDISLDRSKDISTSLTQNSFDQKGYKAGQVLMPSRKRSVRSLYLNTNKELIKTAKSIRFSANSMEDEKDDADDETVPHQRQLGRASAAYSPRRPLASPYVNVFESKPNVMAAKRENDPEEKGEEEEPEDPLENPKMLGNLMNFLLPELHIMGIEKGVKIEAHITLPSDCKGDRMCEFIKEKYVDGAEIGFKGKFDIDGLMMEFAFPTNFNITENIIFSEILFRLTIRGINSKFALRGTLTLKDPPIQLKGEVSVGVTGSLGFLFMMLGMWEKPFGFKYLAFGEVNFGMDMIPGMPIPAIQIGGQLMLGKIGNGKEIKAALYFGLNPLDPISNYVYAKLSKVTVQSIAEAFGKTLKMPKAVLESGFPSGLMLSFTLHQQGIWLEDFQIFIEPGLFVFGKINILGKEAQCTFHINLPEILIEVILPKMSIANDLIQLKKSRDDEENGPLLYVELGLDAVNVEIKAYAYFLGVAAEAQIVISSTHFKFSAFASLFGVVEANVTLEAQYGSLKDAGFSFEACLAINFEKLREAVLEILNKASEKANAAFDRAKAKVAKAKEKFDKAKEKLETARQKIAEKERKLKDAASGVESGKAEMKTDCKEQCPEKCQGGASWNPKCKKVLGKWIGCPGWDDCKTKGREMTCMAKCKASQVGGKIKAGVKQVGAKIALGFMKVAQLALKAVEKVVDVAKKVVTLAEGLLEIVKKVVAAGLAVGAALAKTVLGGIFELHYLCVRAKLEVAKSACMGFDMSFALFSKKFKKSGQVCLNMNFYNSVGKDAVKEEHPDIDQMEDGLKDTECEFAKVDKEEGKVDEEQASADKSLAEAEKQQRHTVMVPVKEEATYVHLMQDDIPQYSLKSQDIRQALKTAAWMNLKDTNFAADATPLQETGDVREVWETIHRYKNPCKTFHKAFDVLQTTTDGMLAYINGVQMKRQSLLKMKRSMAKDIEAMDLHTRTIENSYNMTEEERRDLHHWAGIVKRGMKQWNNFHSNEFTMCNGSALDPFRKQIAIVTESDFGTDFQTYLDNVVLIGAEALARTTFRPSVAKRKRSLHDQLGSWFQQPVRTYKSSKNEVSEETEGTADISHRRSFPPENTKENDMLQFQKHDFNFLMRGLNTGQHQESEDQIQATDDDHRQESKQQNIPSTNVNEMAPSSPGEHVLVLSSAQWNEDKEVSPPAINEVFDSRQADTMKTNHNIIHSFEASETNLGDKPENIHSDNNQTVQITRETSQTAASVQDGNTAYDLSTADEKPSTKSMEEIDLKNVKTGTNQSDQDNRIQGDAPNNHFVSDDKLINDRKHTETERITPATKMDRGQNDKLEKNWTHHLSMDTIEKDTKTSKVNTDETNQETISMNTPSNKDTNQDSVKLKPGIHAIDNGEQVNSFTVNKPGPQRGAQIKSVKDQDSRMVGTSGGFQASEKVLETFYAARKGLLELLKDRSTPLPALKSKVLTLKKKLKEINNQIKNCG